MYNYHKLKQLLLKNNFLFHKSQYLNCYEMMLLMREFEEKTNQLYYEQKIGGFCHLYTGQEACITGVITALNKFDKYITSYRDHVHPIALGTSPKYIMAELFAKNTGISKGKGGSMHIFNKSKNFFGGHAIVGSQIPIGVGISFAEKYKKTKNLCITFFGDGAVRQGSFHESFNLAMLYKLPIIFLIENNEYAMGTSVKMSSNVINLYKLGASYNMSSEVINGMSVEKVHNSVYNAAFKIKNNNCPHLIECKTYRYKGHSMSDSAKYRSKEELEKYKKIDPIEIIKNTILKNNFSTKKKLNLILIKIKKIIYESMKFAENSSFPSYKNIYNNIYNNSDNYYSFFNF